MLLIKSRKSRHKNVHQTHCHDAFANVSMCAWCSEGDLKNPSDEVIRYGAWQSEHHAVIQGLSGPFSSSLTAFSIQLTPPVTRTPA